MVGITFVRLWFRQGMCKVAFALNSKVSVIAGCLQGSG